MIAAERTLHPHADRDTAGLLFAAEMYGVQLDHLAAVLGVSEARARGIAARWRGQHYAESARLGPGAPWTWLTRAGLTGTGPPRVMLGRERPGVERLYAWHGQAAIGLLAPDLEHAD